MIKHINQLPKVAIAIPILFPNDNTLPKTREDMIIIDTLLNVLAIE